MTGKLSKNFHGVGIGPLSNILVVKRDYVKKYSTNTKGIKSWRTPAFHFGKMYFKK